MDWRAIPTLMRLTGSGHTDSVIDSVSEGWKIARARDHERISPEHLLAGMVRATERDRRTIVGRLGLTFNADEVADLTGPVRSGEPVKWLEYDAATRDLFSHARGQARELGHHYVGTEHILLALLLGPSRPASDFLREHGLVAEAIHASIAQRA